MWQKFKHYILAGIFFLVGLIFEATMTKIFGNRYVPDNAAEELIEDGIKAATGVDVDLTPSSKEEK